jgi:nucleotide-binding universal stress UspA family protein
VSSAFRLFIAYDGSPCANSMLVSLESAGLPARADVLVVCVAETWLPPVSVPDPSVLPGSPVGVNGARTLAEFAAGRLREAFPGWNVSAEALMGSPARIIVRKAKEWAADLLVAGAVGHTVWERMLIGSVSHKIANEAPCSVQIVRSAGIASNLLLVGYDGNPGADLAVRAVASRTWAPGTEARLVMAIGYGLPPAKDLEAPLDGARVAEIFRPGVELLEQSGLEVSTKVQEGDPKHVLVDDAVKSGARLLVLGDNDQSILDRILMGTVAEAVLSRAPCSVEIVR